MKTKFIFFFFMITQFCLSQNSSVTGNVVDETTGQTIPGVTVILKNEKGTKASTTDIDGNYIFRDVVPGLYEVNCSYISYTSKTIPSVYVPTNDVVTLNIVMEEESVTKSKESSNDQPTKTVELNDVEVVFVVKKESVRSLLVQQKNSASVSDGISAESIRKTPDKNTSDVLKRISGASIQDNKFVIIRGLNDRYNTSYINGSPLPSSESDRKAFSFDIFPANMLDNIIIYKTATPDLPGEFAGGVIQINTKSTTEKDFQSLSIGGGYNTITTGKNQVYYKGGNTDWLGIDDGTRELPNNFPGYFEFRDLDYTQKANLAKSFKSDWRLFNKNFSPNTNFQYTIGKYFDIKGKGLSMIFSVSHNKSNNYNETERKRYEEAGVDAFPILESDLLDKNYSEQILTGGIANFTLKLNDKNNISFKNLYSINSEDRVIIRKGTPREAYQPYNTQLYSTVRWFSSNKIYTGQLIGDHLLSSLRLKINWVGAYNIVNRSIPNLRRNIYTGYYPDPDNNPQDIIYEAQIANGNGGPDYGGGMFFSENSEKVYNGKVDFSFSKVKILPKFTPDLKLGVFNQIRQRDFFARQLQYNQLGGVGGLTFNSALLTLDDNSIFNNENMGIISPGVGGFTLYDASKFFDKYEASSNLNAGYFMLDNKFGKLRAIIGVRVEDYTQKLNTQTNENEFLNLDTQKTNILPSSNLVYSLNDKQNLRLSYSKTINRPEFRELAPFGFYDFTTQFFTTGNPDLKIAEIENSDFRYEIFLGNSQLISFSTFYKKFKDPIELKAGVNNKEVKYQNAKAAENYGIELEFRTMLSTLVGAKESKILDDFTLFSNLSVIRSKIDVSNLAAASDYEKSRPMQGQSPYVFNAGLQYINKDNGWSASANINRAGNRIAVVGNVEAEPTLWEKSRTFLDFQITKSFFNNKLEAKLNIQNALAQDLIFYQNRDLDDNRISGFDAFVNNIFTGDSQNKDGYNKKEDDLIWRTKYGTSLSFTLSYSF
jgi:hypothetical protein